MKFNKKQFLPRSGIKLQVFCSNFYHKSCVKIANDISMNFYDEHFFINKKANKTLLKFCVLSKNTLAKGFYDTKTR